MVVMCLSCTKETGCSAFTFTVCHCVPRCSAMTYASTCSRQTTHVFEYLHWLTDWRQNESKLESDTGISPLEQKQLVEMIISVEKCEWRRRRRRCQRQSQKHLLPRDVFWDIFIFVAAERNSRLAIVRRSRWRWRWWWRREERWRLSLLPTPTAAAAKITFVFRFAHFNSLSLSFAYSFLYYFRIFYICWVNSVYSFLVFTIKSIKIVICLEKISNMCYFLWLLWQKKLKHQI